ncbi:8004_t:CDS:2, partial [Scutellospora calospora]
TLDDLKEMLRKNKANGEDITSIKQFSSDDKVFSHCIDDIILKLSNLETMTDANEATRFLQKDISGEDATGRVDYIIKSLEELLCITEGKPRNIKLDIQNLAQLESTFQTNKKKRTVDQAFGNNYLITSMIL